MSDRAQKKIVVTLLRNLAASLAERGSRRRGETVMCSTSSLHLASEIAGACADAVEKTDFLEGMK